ncbi:MAG TPA: bifunctional acetate--CoA ligase family protein/GNAT family N-acetyltransferase [Vicinamibacteria bacterium]|nr:bifunctional acetate--CoA ligase family protein/GNAT family N-acetyltransferase [Vicinamibacteria bacterium]
MSVFNLDKILRPERVAVVGASDDPSSVGHAVFRNLGAHFEGAVYPVNPARAEVGGVRAYPSVRELPQRPDLAVICTPARAIADVLGECGETGIRGAVVISAGFGEIGEEGKALERRVTEVVGRFPGLRVVGPNCLGVIVPGIGLNASFALMTPRVGRVAFVSQSGAVCASVLDWAEEEEIGFSCFISVGNMLDVDFGDLIDYLAADPGTDALVLYVESVPRARKFLSAARAFTRTKPIVVYKAGRFPESAKAASSHTGAMAGEDAVYEAAFERAGVVRILESSELFGCAELLARRRIPRRGRLGIVTNAGGPGVMATDALIAVGGTLARLTESTIERLGQTLPRYWSHGNPVDVLGDASPERYADAVDLVIRDEGVDAVLALFTPQALADPSETAMRTAEVCSRSAKPILCSWMGGRAVREAIRSLNQAKIPTYPTPEHAVRAFTALVSFARRQEILYETPRDLPVLLDERRNEVGKRLSQRSPTGPMLLSETDSKGILQAYGLSVTVPRRAGSADEAVAAARSIGFPVVMKIDSPQITHKTDVGGVALNLRSDDDVRSGFDAIVARARTRRPDASISGVTVQSMRTLTDGYEMILGTKKDPTFGAAILVGMGGVTTELLRDRVLGLPPLNERLARRMLESLRCWPLLEGYRGRPGVNLELLLETLIRFSYLVAELPQIRELDINPLFVTPDEVVALDARVILDETVLGREEDKPYSHLAIRPYPEAFVGWRSLPDGPRVLLRPIRPEDEPLWSAMLDSASTESLFQRFRQLVRRTHELAARFCFIDYDREMAIVAELGEGGKRELVGVGRMVADPDHVTAEYAVFVVDAWQGKGLGALLTDYCLEIAPVWGVRELVAYTTSSNTRAVKLFRKRGFAFAGLNGGNELEARKTL